MSDYLDEEYKLLIGVEKHAKSVREAMKLELHFPEFQCYECWYRYRSESPDGAAGQELWPVYPGYPEYNPDCEDCDEICDNYTSWHYGIVCPRCGSRYKLPVSWINEDLGFSLCLTEALKNGG